MKKVKANAVAESADLKQQLSALQFQLQEKTNELLKLQAQPLHRGDTSSQRSHTSASGKDHLVRSLSWRGLVDARYVFFALAPSTRLAVTGKFSNDKCILYVAKNEITPNNFRFALNMVWYIANESFNCFMYSINAQAHCRLNCQLVWLPWCQIGFLILCLSHLMNRWFEIFLSRMSSLAMNITDYRQIWLVHLLPAPLVNHKSPPTEIQLLPLFRWMRNPYRWASDLSFLFVVYLFPCTYGIVGVIILEKGGQSLPLFWGRWNPKEWCGFSFSSETLFYGHRRCAKFWVIRHLQDMCGSVDWQRCRMLGVLSMYLVVDSVRAVATSANV